MKNIKKSFTLLNKSADFNHRALLFKPDGSLEPLSEGTFKKQSVLRGFTLIELLVVMVILGLLITVVTPKIMDRPQQARRVRAKVDIQNLEAALKLFKLDNGFYPSTEQGLRALVEKPDIGRIPKQWPDGGYIEKGKIPLDPWGKSYAYLSPGARNKELDIISYGADGEEGGEGFDADIGNWEVED